GYLDIPHRRPPGRPLRRGHPGHDRGPGLHRHRPGLGRARRRHRRGRRQRRPGRGQHGPAAPVDPRRAPADPRARRRDGDRGPLRHRLPAHRHREEHGVPLLGAGRHVLHADGLPREPALRARLLPGCREAARHRGPGPREGQGRPRPAGRAQPDRLAPRRDRDRRHGDRRTDRDDDRLPRARDGPRPAGAHHRAADEQRVHPSRRHRPADATRCARPDPRLRGADEEAAARVRRALQREPDLQGPAQGRRLPRPRGLHGARHHRTGAPLDRLPVGPAQDAAVLRLRGVRLRGPDHGHLRLLRPLPHPSRRDVAVAADHRAVRRPARGLAGRADHGRRQEDRVARAARGRRRRHGQQPRPHQAHHGRVHGGADPPLQARDRRVPGAGRPGVRRGRVTPRRARCPRRLRRRHPPLPGALPRPVVHEPAGDVGDVRGRVLVRRHRRHRVDRPGDGRRRQV
ncbi:MAG: NADH-ubiquinone oxidoreductase chain D, partial [uncultured Nocardioidaceae bacterium]